MRFIALLVFVLLGACDRTVLTTVRPPDLPMVDLEGTQAAPTAIAIRYALVRYGGAEGATADIERTRDEAAARARMLTGLARQPGQSFREIQTAYSDGPTAQVILRQEDERLPANVVAAAFELRVGEKSTPIETPAGFYVVAREDDPDLGPTRVSVRHVLVGFVGSREEVEGVTRTKEEALAVAREVRASALEDPTRFAELAAEFSDEPGAAESGGDLRSIGRGEMLPQFERAAFALEVGQVSDVVETAYGYHVIFRYQ